MRYTIDEITANISASIGTSTAEDRNLFRQWAVLGLRQLGPNRNDVKVAQITPNSNGLILKPDDFVHGIDMSLFDSSGSEIKYNTNHGGTRIHTDRFSIHDENNQDAITGRVDVSEDAYYYHLGSNRSVVAYALLRYFSFPVDSDGLPTVEEDDLMALILFGRYMWSMRKNDNRSEIQQNFDFWNSERDRRKAAKKVPSQIDMKGIAERYMTLLPINNDSNY